MPLLSLTPAVPPQRFVPHRAQRPSLDDVYSSFHFLGGRPSRSGTPGKECHSFCVSAWGRLWLTVVVSELRWSGSGPHPPRTWQRCASAVGRPSARSGLHRCPGRKDQLRSALSPSRIGNPNCPAPAPRTRARCRVWRRWPRRHPNCSNRPGRHSPRSIPRMTGSMLPPSHRPRNALRCRLQSPHSDPE
jgi:hypothetical protein